MKLLLHFFLCLLALPVLSQSISINSNGAAPHESAILDVNASNKGFLIPRVFEQNLPQNPTEGLMVYKTNGSEPGYYVYEEGEWRLLITNKGTRSFWTKLGVNSTVTQDKVSIGLASAGSFLAVRPTDNFTTAMSISDGFGRPKLAVDNNGVKLGNGGSLLGMLNVSSADPSGIYVNVGNGSNPIFRIEDEKVSIKPGVEILMGEVNTSSSDDLILNSGGGRVAIGYGEVNGNPITPISRLQVEPLGSINDDGDLDLTKSGFLVGDESFGLMMDGNQIEGLGSTTFINFNSDENVSIARGGGYVGIGTQFPDKKLDILDSNWQIRIENEDEVNPNSWYVGTSGTSWDSGGGKLLFSPSTPSLNSLLTLDEDGFVGIGTATPSNALHVVGGSDLDLSSGGFLQLGASSSLNVVVDNNEIEARDNGGASELILNRDGGIVEIGNVSSTTSKLCVNSEENQGAVDLRYDGKTKFRINRLGGVTIGGSQGASEEHEVFFDLGMPAGIRMVRNYLETQILMLPTQFEECTLGNNGNPFSSVYARNFYAGTIASYLIYSDRRIKENILPQSGSLELLRRVAPVSYEIKASHYYRGRNKGNDELVRKNQVGFIAQDFEKVFPHLVNFDEDAQLKSISYVGLVPHLVEAIQEVAEKQEDIDNLTKKVERLEARLAESENLLAKMWENLEKMK